MTRHDIEHETRRRLEEWTRRLVADHATPVLLVAAGRDKQSGCVTICTPADVDDRVLSQVLDGLAATFRRRVR